MSESSVRRLMDGLHLYKDKVNEDDGVFVVEYSGGGDSGDVEWSAKPSAFVSGLIMGVIASDSILANTYDKMDAGDVVLNMVSALLPGGWEINEGSRGTVSFDIHENTISHDHTEYVTESVDHSFSY